VNMGPCQGKMCGRLAVEFCARATGRDSNAVGATTSRPPVIPVELGVLAAGAHHPVRRTPLHHWHQAAGATWTDAGQWKRPEHYGEPLAEARAVRNGVGLIDVSTLGKIEVTGPDAAELLERVYLNKWADLKVGRVRYGVMCDEDGILFDDGVCARLGPDRFYLTATTGNAETVFQWLELWKATWQLDVTVLHHTSGTAAMNLTGPRSRELLSRLSPLGLSAAAFPYMALREGDIAGVRCRLLRIGFVGELGYEIHCPAAHAWGLWEAICEAGRAFDLKPFGVEAQRILRLEKGHLIIGVDTDALSNPLEAGLEWLIRFDKPRFIGREPLVRLKAMGPRSRLVGFLLNGEFAAKDDAQLPSRERQGAASDRSLAPPPRTPQNSVPPVHSIEGCQIVERGRPVGRVTSARHSPTLQRCLALGWVPAPRSKPGERWFVRWNGADVPAVIVSLPFYDPDGIRLKM
jgi:sarcosine oxidase subunit alpha